MNTVFKQLSMVDTTLETMEVEQIAADPSNRVIDEKGEEFQSLVDSIRIFGILQPLHVRRDGESVILIDGERRWRAAKAAELKHVPCHVWAERAGVSDTLAAGLTLNEQRKAHAPIHAARRLREIRDSEGLTAEELGRRTGLSVDRIKTYLALFGASDYLLEFFEKHDVPVKVAAEMMRFEKATGEAKARRLAEQFLDAPLSCKQLAALRKRSEREGQPPAKKANEGKEIFVRRAKEALERRDPSTLEVLAAFLARCGYELAPIKADARVAVRS